jgi:hypothetical protein
VHAELSGPELALPDDMSIFLWLAVVLVALWIAVKLFFKTVGCVVHVLLLLALAAVVWWFLVQHSA